MQQRRVSFKFISLFFIVLFMNQFAKAQLNAADSLLFSQIFTHQKYADDSAFPGNWFVNDSIQSKADLQSTLDSTFKFKLHDFDSLSTMVVTDTLFYDSVRNATYNTYPFVFQQSDPLVQIKFSLNGKSSQSHAFLFPKDTASQSKNAYLMLPGNGINETTNIVQGNGYHNILCFVANQLKTSGDVYAYMKPNEDARAIYWNKLKLSNDYLFPYLDTAMHQPYGLNYLVEIIATIKFLKTKYCNVIVYGLSEGGYAGLLASLIEKPNGAFISAGYAVGFDTSWNSYSVLQERFDSLVFTFHKDTIKSIIDLSSTRYMFTWGNGDATNLMQAEYDSNYTQIFLNDTLHCSYYYNYQDHTFPSCGIIDTFTNIVAGQPRVNLLIVDTTNTDTLISMVSNCGSAAYEFDLFRNDTLHQHYANVFSDTLIALVDSGKYQIRNVVNIYNDSTLCVDSILFDKKTVVPNGIALQSDELMVQYNNPVRDRLRITLMGDKHKNYFYTISDMLGNEKIRIRTDNSLIIIDLQSQPSGIYLLKITDETHEYTGKLIKL